MERVILHSDLNCFYASVEMMLNPALRGKAVAVCGSTESRHGIVLAKSELAKKRGVKTGMVNWEARQCCPEIIMVPPQYDEYLKYSKLTRAIYERYTNQVEGFGMDECWCDVSGSRTMFGDGMTIAEEIRQTVKAELGLTVSMGVSYNKIFAKLGSDLKKPDAITGISVGNFKEMIWPLPASDLLYVGRATTKKFDSYGIRTIGDIANTSQDFLKRLLGINGLALWVYANGLDNSRVMPGDYESPVKSIGHGITCSADLDNNEEVWKVMLELSQDIGHRLRLHSLTARGVQITIRDNDLYFKQYQAPLETQSQSPMEIARKARQLFEANYHWTSKVRAVTVRAINLIPADAPYQISIFEDTAKRERRERLDTAVEEIRSRFGKRAIYSACLMGNLKMPSDGREKVIMPGMMYQ
ncbi:MAG: DNA polymerase IV [Clostridiales bacterium]|nr:DNA polymerase IV [Clostridiales bacterium]